MEPTAPARPPLRRLPGDRMLFGVCAAIARYLAVPPVLVRVGVVLLAFTGVGIPLYVVATLAIPDHTGERGVRWRNLVVPAAVVLLAVAALPVVEQVMVRFMPGELTRLMSEGRARLGIGAFGDAGRLVGRVLGFGSGLLGGVVPWLLVVVGLIVLMRSGRDGGAAGADGGAVDGGLAGTVDGGSADAASTPSGRPSGAAAGSPGSGLARRDGRRSVLGLLGLVVAVGVAGAMVLTSPLTGIPLGVAVGVVVVLLGATLVLSAWRGYARGLLIPAGLAVVVMAPAVVAGIPVESVVAAEGRGTRPVGYGATEAVVVTRAADLVSQRSLSGDVRLDLLDLKLDRDVTVDLQVVYGSVRVVLPNSATTRVRADAIGGSVVTARPHFSEMLGIPPRNPAVLKRLAGGDRRVLSGDLDGLSLASAAGVSRLPDGTQVELAYGLHPLGIVRHQRKTVTVPGPGSDVTPHTLTLRIRVAWGDIGIVEPIWEGVPKVDSGTERSGATAGSDASGRTLPTQVCARAGGIRGDVKPCSAVPQAAAVPLCLVAATEVTVPAGTTQAFVAPAAGDCREMAAAGQELRLACRSPDWPSEYVACRSVGVRNGTSVAVLEAPVHEGEGMFPSGTIAPLTSVVSPTSPPTTSAPPAQGVGGR